MSKLFTKNKNRTIGLIDHATEKELVDKAPHVVLISIGATVAEFRLCIDHRHWSFLPLFTGRPRGSSR
jgi:hypothetical protein